MNIDDCYPSKHLKASDIGEGKEVTVVIDRIEVVQMKGDDGHSETKPVVFFVGKDKGLVLNIVNKNTIKKLYGAETENWIGKAIRIGTSWVDAFGDQALALRVRPSIPAPKQGHNGPAHSNGNGHAPAQRPIGHRPPAAPQRGVAAVARDIAEQASEDQYEQEQPGDEDYDQDGPPF